MAIPRCCWRPPHLAQTRRFRGTVHFVFQPAEENLGGARKMVEEGLFERFPMDAIYALHNWPGMPLGSGAQRWAMMASLDAFEITLTGKSCHAAMPESGADPIVAAAQLIMALQTIPSRRLSPQDSAVVSITQINGGEAINVLPDKVVLRGTFRCLSNRVRERVRG
jgi:hippurate hydrolase